MEEELSNNSQEFLNEGQEAESEQQQQQEQELIEPEERDDDQDEVDDGGEAGGVVEGTTAYNDIFGGDSDLSENESADEQGDDDDDEEEEVAPKKKVATTYREEEPSEGEEEGTDDDGEAGGDGEYEGGNEDREEKRNKISNLKFKKRAPKKAREEGEEGDGEESQPRKRKKKTKNRELNMEEPEEEIDPEVAKRHALHARIDDIIKKPKGTARKKTKGQQDDDLEAMNDEAIIILRNDMLVAAEADIEENEAGKFAYHKLKMLPEVVRLMQKSSLAESIVENGLLEAVRKWLEPLQDGSLPAVNIQRPLFEILRTLTIDTGALRTCGLGKIVYFYTKCKRVEPTIARHANALVSDWMRPIIRNSKSLADREVEVTSVEDIRGHRRNDAAPRVAGKRVAVENNGSSTPSAQRPTNETIARRHARIPEMLTATFKVAPMKDAKDRENGNGMSSSNVVVGGKMKTYKKKLIAGQQASRRV